MANVSYQATNHPVCASPIVFDIAPVAPFWISEVLVYLNSSYPPPPAYGRIRAGNQAHPSHLTIFVDQAIFDQICNCLGGSAVDLSIDYNESLTVTNVFCVAEALRTLLARLDKKVDHIAETLHALKMELKQRQYRDSEITELVDQKAG